MSDSSSAADLERSLQDTIAAMRVTSPFFAHLVRGAKIRFRGDLPQGVPAASAGARDIFLDPKAWRVFDANQRLTVLGHEATHHLLLHTDKNRHGERNPRRYNVAGDVLVNTLLREGGLLFDLPFKIWLPESLKELGITEIPVERIERMTTEEVYELLPDPPDEVVVCIIADGADEKDGEGGGEGKGEGKGRRGQGQGGDREKEEASGNEGEKIDRPGTGRTGP